MESIEVIVRFTPQGQITPLRFTWKGRSYLVESTGRRWATAEGQHILVMMGGGGLFELLFVPAQGCWYLGQVCLTRMAA